MRFAVTGGRRFHNPALVRLALGRMPEDAVLVHGGATGADTLCARQWQAWGRLDDPYPADWPGPCDPDCPPGHRRARKGGGTYCPFAGFRRNQDMVDSDIELLIAFPGGRGTADMVERCERTELRVIYAEQIEIRAGEEP